VLLQNETEGALPRSKKNMVPQSKKSEKRGTAKTYRKNTVP
jgi:hypothetical protein